MEQSLEVVGNKKPYIYRVGEVMTQADLEERCTTFYPVFHDVCLNRWVLEIASLTLKTKPGAF